MAGQISAASPIPPSAVIQADLNVAHEVHHEVERPSDMRRYWHDTDKFSWTNGSETENQFDLNDPPPFEGIEILNSGPFGNNKTSDCHVTRAKAVPTYIRFKREFVVKEIKEMAHISNVEAAKEVRIMKRLQHPHIAALLGSFLQRDRLHILIYPAAVCDLEDLMISISDDMLNHAGRPVHRPSANLKRIRGTILEDHLEKRIECLRFAFSCLCQALAYLHKCNVRHKDIKPRNILVDSQGYVLLTDFGSSEQFEEHETHVTMKERSKTKRYQSPEKYHNKPRGDSDDIWSLGCVFLEMMSIILGCDWASLSAHFDVEKNLTGKESIICVDLNKVATWIHELQLKSRLKNSNLASTVDKPIEIIRTMLDGEPKQRPKAEGLFRDFLFPGQTRCVDCYPDQRFELKQTKIQAKAAEAVGHELEAIQQRRVSVDNLSRHGSNASRLSKTSLPSSFLRPQHRRHASQSPSRLPESTYEHKRSPQFVNLDPAKRPGSSWEGMSEPYEFYKSNFLSEEGANLNPLQSNKNNPPQSFNQTRRSLPADTKLGYIPVGTNVRHSDIGITKASTSKASLLNVSKVLTPEGPPIMVNDEFPSDNENANLVELVPQTNADSDGSSTAMSVSPIQPTKSTMKTAVLNDTDTAGSSALETRSAEIDHTGMTLTDRVPQRGDTAQSISHKDNLVSGPNPSSKPSQGSPVFGGRRNESITRSKFNLTSVTEQFKRKELSPLPKKILLYNLTLQKFEKISCESAYGFNINDYEVYEIPPKSFKTQEVWFFGSPYSLPFRKIGFWEKVSHRVRNSIPYVMVLEPGRHGPDDLI